MEKYYDDTATFYVRKLSKDELNQMMKDLRKDWRYQVWFVDYNHASLDDIIFPHNVVSIKVTTSKLETLDNLVLPDNLIEFDCYNNKITSIKGLILPETLKYLNFSYNQITDISGLRLPDSLIKFEIRGNQVSNIDRLRLSPNLEEFYINNNKLVNIYNIVFPKHMKKLELGIYDKILLINPQFNSITKYSSDIGYRVKFDTSILKQTRDQLLFLYLNSNLYVEDRTYLLLLIEQLNE